MVLCVVLVLVASSKFHEKMWVALSCLVFVCTLNIYLLSASFPDVVSHTLAHSLFRNVLIIKRHVPKVDERKKDVRRCKHLCFSRRGFFLETKVGPTVF